MRKLNSALSVAVLTVAATFATAQDALACRSSVGDFVWVDTNANGLQDPGEPGLNGVTVRITADHVTPARTFVTANKPGTSEAGYYTFTVLCDTNYVISVDATTVPAGYSTSPIGVGSNPAIDSNQHTGTVVNVPAGTPGVDAPPNLTIDFGYTPPAPCAGRIGDFVWSDLNNNGIQDAGEPGIRGAVVTLNSSSPIATSSSGGYSFAGLCGGTYTVCVAIPPGSRTSPANAGANDAVDSDGLSDGHGNSCATVTLPSSSTVDLTVDFGLHYPPAAQTGTGTPGYWKNHPEAWPVDVLTLGGVQYTRAQALAILDMSDGDKTVTLFRALAAATLNVLSGTDSSCIASTISEANDWLATYGPVGSNVRASSLAWRVGEPLYRTLDNYNNGMLCAPARD